MSEFLNIVSMHIIKHKFVDVNPYPFIEGGPCGKSLTEIPQNPDDYNTGLQSIGPSLKFKIRPDEFIWLP